MPLLQSTSLGSLTLKNRVVLAPMTRARSGEERIPNSLMAEYYAQRAGAGLIISEATVVSRQGIGWNNTPGIYSDAQVEGWKVVTQAIHNQGSLVFMQLWHCGRASHSSFHPDIGLPVAPSAIRLNGDGIYTPNGKEPYETPRALETAEVQQVVSDYRAAAIRAKESGVDGIEIHAANGYLIDQFLQSKTNHRTDEYGGNSEKRFRLLREVVAAVLETWPADRVGVRLAPNGVFNDMGSPEFREDFLYYAEELNKFGLAYLHILDGLAFGFHNLGEPLTLKEFRSRFDRALIGNCGYTTELANERIASGDADMIAFGRPFISNPDFVERVAEGHPLAPEAEQKFWYSFDSEGYTSYPPFHPESL